MVPKIKHKKSAITSKDRMVKLYTLQFVDILLHIIIFIDNSSQLNYHVYLTFHCCKVWFYYCSLQVESLKDRLEHTQTELDKMHKDNIDLKSRLHKESSQVGYVN